jgi:hypothetical protein
MSSMDLAVLKEKVLFIAIALFADKSRKVKVESVISSLTCRLYTKYSKLNFPAPNSKMHIHMIRI